MNNGNKIVQEGNPVLRQQAESVSVNEFNSLGLREIINQMNLALDACEDGVAIAAPQIGISKRIFIISKRAFKSARPIENQIFINPIIVKLSKKKAELEEGCLSVRWIYGRVKRSEKATIEAQDFDGHKFIRHASGLVAQIFQHEIDHLNGILFVDKATDLQEIPPEK